LADRAVWTDERIDDLAVHIERTFDRVDKTVDRLDKTVDRLWDEFRDFRAETRAYHRQFARIGWAIAGILLAQIVAAASAAVLTLT
jgi:hypothetical protein